MRCIFQVHRPGLFVVFVAVILTMTACGSGDVDDKQIRLAGLLPETIGEWSRQDSISTFDRESIFEYIDGAGEVYNSYAFGEVIVSRYTRNDSAEIVVELFDMGNDNDAYGVFSYAREDEQPGIGGGYEQRGTVLCFWQNRYYVCVALQTATETKENDLKRVAQAVSGRLPPGSDRPALVDVLPSDRLIAHSARYFHVQAALNYNYYLARDNILRLSRNTNGVLARYEPGATYLLVIEYPDDEAAATALASFKKNYLPDAGDADIVPIENGKFVGSRQTDRLVVIVLDARSADVASGLMNATVNGLDPFST